MAADRMFRVIVLGGIALTASSACGGTASSDSSTTTGDAGDAVSGDVTIDTFPTEGPPIAIDSGADTTLVDSAKDTFPMEGADTTPPPDTKPIDTGVDTFPKEGPMMLDSGDG